MNKDIKSQDWTGKRQHTSHQRSSSPGFKVHAFISYYCFKLLHACYNKFAVFCLPRTATEL